MSTDEYDAIPRVRSTTLKSMMKPQGPRAYFWDKASKPTKSMQLGTLVHAFLLEGRTEWCVVPAGMRRDARSADYRQFLLDNPGLVPITEAEHADVSGMINGVQRNQQAMQFLTDNAFTEETILWTHEETGIEAKARIDLYSTTCLADLKTTRVQTEHDFIREVVRMRYEFSAAFYEQARDYEVGRRIRAPFCFLVVSNQYPYYSYVWQMGADLLARGHRQVNVAFARLKECQEEQAKCIAEGRDILEAWPDDEEKRQGTFTLTAPQWAYPLDEEGGA